MRVFKNGWFTKFARKEKISDAALCEAVARAEKGLIDADLGGGLIKQRVARPGAGKSGGYRTIVFFRTGNRAVFAFGFSKSDRTNLNNDDAAALKKAARIVFFLTDEDMNLAVENGDLIEVKWDDENI